MSEETRENEIEELKGRLAQLEEEREQERQAAAAEASQRAYGRGGGGAGTPAGGFQPVDPANDAVTFVHGRLQRGEGLMDSAGKIAFSRFAGQRLAEAFEAARDRPSYKANGDRRG